NKVFSLHYFPNILHPVYQYRIPTQLANLLPKTKSYSGLSTTTKVSASVPKYEGGFIPSNIFGKVTETFSLLSHPLIITFFPAFVTPIPSLCTAGNPDPPSLEIYKSIFLTSALLILL